MRLLELKEDKSYQPPSIDVGDEVLVGKFKNRRAEVKGFTTDDNNQPVLKTSKGDQHLFKPRIAKLMPDEVNEAFDQPYPLLRWEKGDFGDVDAIARLDDGTFLSIMFNKGFSKDSKEEAWSVEFYRNNSQEVTGEGDAQRVFATVLSAIQTFIKKYTPNRITFTASKEVEQGQNAQSRARLYDSLVQRYARSWGFRAFRADTGNKVIYELNRINQVAESTNTMNFEEGDCPIFAIALHRLSKLPLMALIEYDEQMSSAVLIHAYVKLNNKWRIDATGETDVNWMLQKYPNNGNAEEIEISEKDLIKLGYGKNKCPMLQQVLPHAKEVLQTIDNEQGVTEGKDFDRCFDQACKLYDRAVSKNLEPQLVQVADFQGDGNGADPRWMKLPQHVWQHYVVIVGDQVLDPTAKQFGDSMPTQYQVSDLDRLWGKQYQIRPRQGVAENESEILDDLEEGWKDWVAGAALGAAALSPQAADAKSAPQQKPAITQQAQGDAAYATKLILKPEAKILIQTARAAGMRGKELAQFVAQCAHETANFSSLKELGGRLDFKKYDPKHNPRKAKILGNKQVGDGAKYHGRGYIQLTGRDNYKRAGLALGLPLEEQPDLVERPDIAAKVAVWFWQNQVAPKVSNFNDTAQVTKPINSGLKGLDDRHNKYASIMALMGSKS